MCVTFAFRRNNSSACRLVRTIPITYRALHLYCFSIQRADKIAEWIKGLLAVPFVICSQPTGVFEPECGTVAQMAAEAHRRYAEVMQDVEDMIDDHSK